MTPPMHRRVQNVFVESGLTAGYIVQSLFWNDTGKASDRFIVFRPNGGTSVDRDMAADYYVMVDVISKERHLLTMRSQRTTLRPSSITCSKTR